MPRFRTSLALRHGILWVARWDLSWRVVPHDLDGRELSAGFAVPSEPSGRALVTSIAVDEDRRVWVADAGAGRVRAFTAFGRELEGLPRDAGDRAGSLAEPVSIDADGVEDGAVLLVASAGARQHALHLVPVGPRAGAARVSLRARDTAAGFAGLSRAALRGRHRFACEPSTGLVHAWRDGQFFFAFRAPDGGAPVAVRALADGRLVLATGGEAGGDAGGDDGGALHLLDASGRLVRTLARGGRGEGDVQDPEDLAVEDGAASDARRRLVVADADGSRFQVFNLEGDCYGAFGAHDPTDALEEGT
jgi:hypothetical protein